MSVHLKYYPLYTPKKENFEVHFQDKIKMHFLTGRKLIYSIKNASGVEEVKNH